MDEQEYQRLLIEVKEKSKAMKEKVDSAMEELSKMDDLCNHVAGGAFTPDVYIAAVRESGALHIIEA